MSNALTQDWLLKVIAGPNQGAELLLESAQTLIGTDDECDVVLRDVLVAPQHASLVIEAEQLFVEPLGGRVFLHGKRVREGRQKVEEFSFVTVGGTYFVLGREKSAWPLLSAADLPELEKEAADPAAAQEKDSGNAAESTDAASAADKPSAPTAMPPVNKRAAWFGVGLGVILLAGSLFVWKRINDTGIVGLTLAKGSSETTRKASAEQLLEELNLHQDVSIQEFGQRLTASGYVVSEEVRREIQSRLREAFPGMSIHIWSLDRISSTARKLLSQHKLSLQVESLPAGDLRVKGTTDDAAGWSKVKGLLLSEISGVGQVIDEVQVKSQALVLKSDPPARVVAPNSAASASVAPATTEQAVEEAPPVMEPQDTRFVESIQATPEDFAWMKLNDGSVMFLGARLQDGSTLVEVHKDKVVLLQNGEKREIAIGEKITKTSTEMKSAAKGSVN